MDKVPEKKKGCADLSIAVLFVCFVLRTCGMCWLDGTDKNQQRAFSCGSKAAIKHRNQCYWQLTKDMGKNHTKQSVYKRSLNV